MIGFIIFPDENTARHPNRFSNEKTFIQNECGLCFFAVGWGQVRCQTGFKAIVH